MFRVITALISLAMVFSVQAADSGAQYVHLQPAFVLNYGNNTKGRMKYIRTDVALRVVGAEAAGKVNHHQAYIRNQMVLLLSQQDDVAVNSAQGREKLRQVALEEVRALMSELEGQPYVEDLYFQNFVAQN
ncbi:MAG: flagellar basal body-associated FliL family protein [Bermanella sp.]